MIHGMKRISEQSFVQDIVKDDYRTASVFRKHGIEFCCGVKLSLELACDSHGLDSTRIKTELEKVVRTISVSNSLKFDEWDVCFLSDYIIHVHHEYLRLCLPDELQSLEQFARTHRKQFDFLDELLQTFSRLSKEMLTHINHEEEIIFPYIKQIALAYNNKESFAGLLVRTLGKPVSEEIKHEEESTMGMLIRMRELTNEYSPPPSACTSHRVNFLTLREIDNDIVQHLHLENNILFPKAIEMEKELLQQYC
jgi:regulator of cell morphogenesis and NO signaling